MMKLTSQTRVLSYSFSCITALSFSACGDPDGEGDTEAATSSSSSGPGSENSTGAPTDGGSEDGVDVPEDQPDPYEGEVAGGITVTGIDINQAVSVDLVTGGTWVAADARNAPVIPNRPALFRVTGYDLAADFQGRMLQARLALFQPDGTINLYTDDRMVSGAPGLDTLDGAPHWLVEGAHIQPGTEFHVSFYEPMGGSSSGGDTAGAHWPSASANQALESLSEDLWIDLMVVPCDYTPTDEEKTNFEAYMYNVFPVSEMVVTWHDQVSGCGDSFYAAETFLPMLREQEGAPPHQYWGASIGGPGTNGGGYSINYSGSTEPDFRRTFANNNWRQWGLSADLFAHELGHNHARPHPWEDSSYPHDTDATCAGRVTTGFGVMDGVMPLSGVSNDVELGHPWIDNHTLLPPTEPGSPCNSDNFIGEEYHNDFMSYAYPFWVSDYTFRETAVEVAAINSWATRGLARGWHDRRTLRLTVTAEGEYVWTATRGASSVDEDVSVGQATCYDGDAVVAQSGLRPATGWRQQFDERGQLTALHKHEVFEAALLEGLRGDRCEFVVGDKTYTVTREDITKIVPEDRDR